MSDLISRQAAIDALNGLIDRFEQILRDIRETNVDDSVCGMCEYDGAYIGQSGDWCNECPGFDKDDCFKLSDECRKRWLKSVDLPSADRPQGWIPCSERLPEEEGWYLVTIQNDKTEKRRTENDLFAIGIAEAHKLTPYKFCKDGHRQTVIAWMPLPEPYKGERKDDE